ncbi:hypothetical protein LLEC1_00950 [Akanthomyces lecanii]|uniref:Uncharacterized protein n=1 Tax=Cordyceps confragosa TaxID=2714763 RepID=A0A179I494_CORDF|nr:hypothetical protein LLEC1_00950 [Akanthomyces lecanii]
MMPKGRAPKRGYSKIKSQRHASILCLVQQIKKASSQIHNDALVGERASHAVQGGRVADGLALGALALDDAHALLFALILDDRLEVADELGPDLCDGQGDGDVDGGRVLQGVERGGAVEHRRVALGREAVLVRVDADAGHALEAKVKRLRLEAGLFEAGNDKGAEAAVDVQPELVAQRQARQPRDVVDDAVREVGRGAYEQDGVAVDEARDAAQVDLVVGRGAVDKVHLDLEVVGGLAEGRVRGHGENPVLVVLSHSTLDVGLLARRQTGEEDAFGAAAGRGAGRTLGRVEHVEDHADDLGLHLTDAREDVRVDGVGDGKEAVGVGLELDQLRLAVVDGAGDVAVLPAGVVHVGQTVELGADILLGHPLLGQRQVARLRGRDELGGHLVERLLDLGAYLAADTGGLQEPAVEDAADVAIQLEDGADDTAALELPVEATRPSGDKVDEDDVADPARKQSDVSNAVFPVRLSDRRVHYRSRFTKPKDSAEEAAPGLRGPEPRRLIGMRDEPGMMLMSRSAVQTELGFRFGYISYSESRDEGIGASKDRKGDP